MLFQISKKRNYFIRFSIIFSILFYTTLLAKDGQQEVSDYSHIEEIIRQIDDLNFVGSKKSSIRTLRKLETDLLNNLKIIYKDDAQFIKDIDIYFTYANGNPQKVLYGLKRAVNGAVKRTSGNSERYKHVVKIIDKTEKTSNSKRFTSEICEKISVVGKYYHNLSEPTKSALRSEIPSYLLSGIEHSYKYCNDKESAYKAITNVVEEYGLYKTSNYVSNAIIQKIGNKTVITALVGDLVGSTLVKKGVATFVSDGTNNVYHFMKGDISKEQFFKETSKSVGRSIAAASMAVATVCIANTVFGPHIIAMVPFGNEVLKGIGSFAGVWVFDKVVSLLDKTEEIENNTVLKDFAYQKLDERNFFFIEDVLGNLPLEMQKRITAFNSEELKLAPSAFDKNFMNKPTAFNAEDWKLNSSVYEDNFMSKPTAFNNEDWIIRNGQYENK